MTVLSKRLDPFFSLANPFLAEEIFQPVFRATASKSFLPAANIIEEKEKFLKKHSLETGTYQFNLTQGPLYVMELIKLDAMHHQLTFTGHHIIGDNTANRQTTG